jgi:hypothetical protein
MEERNKTGVEGGKVESGEREERRTGEEAEGKKERRGRKGRKDIKFKEDGGRWGKMGER